VVVATGRVLVARWIRSLNRPWSGRGEVKHLEWNAFAEYRYHEVVQRLGDRATRLAVDARRDPASRPGAIARIAGQTGVGRVTLRNWVRKAEDAELPVEPVDTTVRIRQLEAGNRPAS